VRISNISTINQKKVEERGFGRLLFCGLAKGPVAIFNNIYKYFL
jgi:hypothetical protein